MTVLADLTEEEKYLVAILLDESGVDQCEFLWTDETAKDLVYRCWDFQVCWYRNRDKFQVDQCARAVGKALALDTIVPTPTGWTTMGDLRVGDQVFDEHENVVNVTVAYDILYGRTCFELLFSGGWKVTADADHEWLTLDRESRNSRFGNPEKRTTRQIAETLTSHGEPNHSVGERRIWSVNEVPSVPVRCIEVDSDSHLYLVSQGRIPTHNSNGIQMRAFVFPFTNPGEEMLLTAPEMVHLDPITRSVEGRILSSRITRDFLQRVGSGTGIRHQPFEARFRNGAKIVGRIPQITGRGVKGMHPMKLELDEGQDYPEAGYVELTETLKFGNDNSQWRTHGVSRGVRDRYYQLTQPGSGWTVHKWTAMHRPDWTEEERQAKSEMYGSINHPDYRRNILGLHGDAQSSLFVLSRLLNCVDQDQDSIYNTMEYQSFRINEERLRESGQPIESLITLPEAHRKYKKTWAGADIGLTSHPTEILVFGEEVVKGKKRIKALCRVHLERISSPDQRAVFHHLWKFYKIRSFGIDRMQPVSEPVLTPDGWRPIGDLVVGDQVIGSTGAPVTVTGVYPQADRRVMKVTCVDGSWTRCGPEHLWTVVDSQTGRRLTVTTEQLVPLLERSKQRRWMVPVLTGPAALSGGNLPIDPYLMGALLGNGNFRKNGGLRFASGDEETVRMVEESLPDGLFLKKTKEFNFDICGSGVRRGPDGRFIRTNVILAALKEFGLLGVKSPDKWIPEEYLNASISDRVAILQGLLDTDGHISTQTRPGRRQSCSVGMNTTSLRLAEGLVQLVESLGGSGRIRSHPRRKPNWSAVHRVTLAIPYGVKPFRLTRKAVKVVGLTPKRFIKEIAMMNEQEDSVCIRVDAKDHLYVTRHHLLTHNTGIGLPIYSEIKESKIPGFSNAIRGYVFNSSIIIGYEPPAEDNDDPDSPLGKPITGSVLEVSSDYLRSLVDEGEIHLPWDIDLIREFQGQTYVLSKSTTDPYGRKLFNKGKFHCLDAARMAALAHQQERIEAMSVVIQPKDESPVFDSFLSY